MMITVLLLEVNKPDKAIVYNPNTRKEFSISVTQEQSDYYELLLNETEEDIFVIYNEEENQLSYIDDEKELS
ncbi:hypothetical protein JTF06_04500 [Desemzia sp. RIT804]|uniref:hypothetical protein n=1 Tax=Desemzia sp. RIT 804 TaxID=2810209 RepID=UPI001951176A|nr:hypothetical protein [Desemzia sp. RIT 804]MBM6613984.1 hypothetical protein [Desemzia sp. RIT 804]MBM6614067.1 hypothetical protein [Desemzia sp. RIT 804]MBM6614150.1 hypothetical protein [Desemzia sp. RIT 804]